MRLSGYNMDHASLNTSRLFIELGCAIVGLAVLARAANRWGFSTIPLYFLAGLDRYNQACVRCHPATTLAAHAPAPSGNCVGCHMPKRRAEDVVQSVITDHLIQRRPPRPRRRRRKVAQPRPHQSDAPHVATFRRGRARFISSC